MVVSAAAAAAPGAETHSHAEPHEACDSHKANNKAEQDASNLPPPVNDVQQLILHSHPPPDRESGSSEAKGHGGYQTCIH